MQHMNAQNTSSDMPSPQEINCIVTLLPHPHHFTHKSCHTVKVVDIKNVGS